MLKNVRPMWRTTVVILYLSVGWIVGLAIVLLWILDGVLAYLRERRARAAFARCPSGHAVAQYGLFRCTCGAVSQSWAWVCPICRAESGFVDCPTCGLSVRNPRYG